MRAFQFGDRQPWARMIGLGFVVLGLAGCTSTGKKYPEEPSQPAASTKPVEISKEARLRVAASFRDAGDYASALRLYQQAVAADPKDAEALVGMGDLYARLHAFDAARQSYEQALSAAPQNALALAGMGQALISQGQPEAALDFLTKAAAAQPKSPRVLNSLGLTYDLLGRHEEAQVTYGRGLDFAPDDGALMNNLALSFVLSKNYETSIRILSGLVTSGQAPEGSRQNLAMVYALSGDFTSAERLLALELTPDQLKGRLSYFRRLQAANTEAQTRALFLGIDPMPVIAPEQQAKAEAGPAADTSKAPAPVEIKPEPPISPPAPAPVAAVAADQPAPKATPLAPPPAKVAPAAAQAPAKRADPPNRYSVQLGAYKSEAFALTSWQKMATAHRELFQGYSAAVMPVDLGEGGVNYRLYIKEISESAAAQGLCDRLKQQKLDCLVRRFPAEASK